MGLRICPCACVPVCMATSIRNCVPAKTYVPACLRNLVRAWCMRPCLRNGVLMQLCACMVGCVGAYLLRDIIYLGIIFPTQTAKVWFSTEVEYRLQ